MKVVSKNDSNGKVVYSSEIVKSVVDCALDEIDGVVKYEKGSNNKKQVKNYVKIDHVGDVLYLDVYIKLLNNVNVTFVASQVQHTIKNSLETMTEFKVKDVNVHVVDVEFTDNNWLNTLWIFQRVMQFYGENIWENMQEKWRFV